MGAPTSPHPPPPPDASPRLLRLRCAVQHYEWGRRGDASLAARLAAASDPDVEIDPDLPYAELWMGTHPAAPSTVLPGGEPLGGWLERNPDALGPAVATRWNGDLPFLFKVLSVGKPLSIQAHPDKERAEELHALRPDTYRDDNHKPEMAIAITDFRALFGFAGIEELKDVIRTVPELGGLIGHEDANKLMAVKEYHGGDDVKSILESAFTKLMKASKEAVSEAVTKLKDRLNDESKIRTLTEKEEVILSLERQYPEDVGVLAALLFNYVKLSPGEAIYIGANEPHAYLSGECIECMATSDNVVRAGLTPKYRDVETLCSMLTYKQVFPEILRGVPVQPFVRRYTPPPPTNEFEVDCCLLPQGEVVVMDPAPTPSIFLVITGEGDIQVDSMFDKAKEGDVFFVPACTEVKLSASGHASMQLYRAGVNGSDTVVAGKRSQLQNICEMTELIMKRDSTIASLFRKHEAKKIAPSSSPLVVDDEPTENNGILVTCLNSTPPVQSDVESEIESEGATPHPPSPQHPYDAQFLPYDNGERIPISSYNVNDQDDVRRAYIGKGPCQPFEHDFPTRKIQGKNRHFSFAWFMDFHWLEYSIGKDAAFCFVCYLFKGRSNGGPRGDAFVKDGFRDWKRPEAFKKHMGGVRSIHNQAQEKYNLFVTPNTKIDNVIVKVSNKDLLLYKTRLRVSGQEYVEWPEPLNHLTLFSILT